MEKLIHIKEASEFLGISQEALNILIESKKIDFVVSSMTKKIKQSTIEEILGGLMEIYGGGNKIENLELVTNNKEKK